MDRLSRWQRMVDQQSKEAVGDGDVSHLPGAGKRLQFDDERTPPELRVAFKIMADNDVEPDWIAAGKALDTKERELRESLSANARRRSLVERGAAKDPRLLLQSEKRWQRFSANFIDDVERYNRETLVYNLKLPPGLPRREQLRADALIASALEDVRD